MTRTFSLPEGYREIAAIEPARPVRSSLLLALLSLLLVSEILLMPTFVGIPMTALPDITLSDILLWIGTLAVVTLIYVLVKAFINRLSGARPTRLSANDSVYMSRGMYIVTAILPDAVIVALLLTARVFVPDSALVAIYFAFISFSVFALFDLCVILRILRAPSRTLVRNTGKRIALYAPR